MKGWRSKRREMSRGVRHRAGGDKVQRGGLDGADAPAPDPLRRLTVIGPEAPVLVHHQPHAIANVGDQPLGFRQGRRERLLAQDWEAVIGGKAREVGVHGTRRGDIDGVQAAMRQHFYRAAEACGDAELAGAPRGILGGRVGNGDNRGFVAQCLPGAQMMLRHPTRADHPDLQRRGSHSVRLPVFVSRMRIPMVMTPTRIYHWRS